MTVLAAMSNWPWLQWGLVALCIFCVFLLIHVIELRRNVAERTAGLQASEQKLAALLDNAGALVSIKDIQLKYRYVNKTMADRIGLRIDEILGRDDFAFFDADTAKIVRANDRRVLHTSERLEVEENLATSPLTPARTYLTVKVPLLDTDGQLMGICSYGTDITELRRADDALRLAATVFESQEGMLIAGPDQRILRVNQALVRLTGFEESELLHRPARSLQSGRNDAAFCERVWKDVAAAGHWAGEMWIRRKSGEAYPAWINIACVRGAGGDITHYVSTQMDISDRKAAEDEIRKLAYYDSLTGLPNRRLMSDRLQRTLSHGSSFKGDPNGALMVVDLDNFKDLNDTLGHDVGDELLCQVAERLEQCSRRGDTVSRLGGDEFAMLIESLNTDIATVAAEIEAVARNVLFMMSKPFALGERVHHTSCSIGIALYVNASGGVDEMLKRADLAMYEAKAQGRNTLCFFDPRTQEAVARRTAIEADLRNALERGELVLHYQAQIEQEGSLIGAEALLRWEHPERGLVGPNDFIAIAEATGLIESIGAWVLREACDQLVRWSRCEATAGISLAVNVSVRQFRQSDFVEEVLAILELSGANPALLKLELTESVLLDNAAGAIAHMTTLRALGVRFSLDDFGTGYSSLSYLQRLPLDQLKIDQSFVHEIMTDANGAAIARTIVALAQSLSLSVIAEGVETEAQRALLAALGCTAWQGYLFAKPAPAHEMMAQYARWSDRDLGRV